VWGDFSFGFDWRWKPTAEQLATEEIRRAGNVAVDEPVDSEALLAALASAPWPHLRGPRGDSSQTGLRFSDDWSAHPPREVWRNRIGPAWSSFAIGADRLFTQEQRLEDDLRALNFVPMHATPRASSAIPEIRGFIGKVLDRGYAYLAGGSVYFDVARFSEFGSISGYEESHMLQLARERGGNVDDPNKRHPLDFVLWQPSAHDEPAWDTIWGSGRPGWHIECSALALRELGTTIDLHGGGTDLIYPHHECERAQSEAATGVPFVKHWMHVAMVWMDGHKMSKSRGNLVFVDALRKQYDPRAIRLGLLVNHYRHEWEWDKGLIDRATARLGKWMAVGVDSKRAITASATKEGEDMLGTVRRHLDNDLDAPSAIATIDDAANAGVDVRPAAALLGVTW